MTQLKSLKKVLVSKMKVLIINGPNLNMLGKRDKNHYGELTLEKINDIVNAENDG